MADEGGAHCQAKEVDIKNKNKNTGISKGNGNKNTPRSEQDMSAETGHIAKVAKNKDSKFPGPAIVSDEIKMKVKEVIQDVVESEKRYLEETTKQESDMKDQNKRLQQNLDAKTKEIDHMQREYGEQIAKLNSECQSKLQQAEDVKKQSEVMTDSQTMSKIQQLQLDNQALIKREKDLEDELKKLNSKWQSKVQQLEDEKRKSEVITDPKTMSEIQQLKRENQALIKREEELKEGLEKLSSEGQSNFQQLDDDKKQQSELSTDSQNTSEMQQLQCDNESLMKREMEHLHKQEKLVRQWTFENGELRTQKENLEKKCRDLEAELQQSQQTLNQALHSNTQLSNKKAELDGQFQELQRVYLIKVQELEKSANSIREANIKASNSELDVSQLVKTLNEKEVILKQNHDYTKELLAYSRQKESENDRLNSEITQHKNMASRRDQAHARAIENEKARYVSLSQNFHKLDEERSGLVLRLSKVAGAKLTAGNSNIADLSDENRPTKLAEKFSELYDNEWTDAFEKVCEKMEENEGIQYMLKVLQTAFNFCNEITTSHFESMKKSATTVEFTIKKKTTVIRKEEIQKKELEKEDTQIQNIPTEEHMAPEAEDIDRGNGAPLSLGADTSTGTPDDLTNADNDPHPETKVIGQEDKHDNRKVERMDTDESFPVANNQFMSDQSQDDAIDHCSGESTTDPSTKEATGDQTVVNDVSEGQNHDINKKTMETNVDTGVQEPSEQKPEDSLLANDAVEQVESETVSITLSDSLTDELYKQLLDLKKLIAIQMQGNVLQEITKAVFVQLDVPGENSNLDQYIAKCVEICWYMGLQEPPLQIVFEVSDDATKFDTNTYKPYTRTGKHIEYIVWPPLFLKKDGPMLSKGVAQGTK